ncbi:MAG: hypothetical protein ABIZ05_14805 [Pseudonocardiaceae bacterium]
MTDPAGPGLGIAVRGVLDALEAFDADADFPEIRGRGVLGAVQLQGLTILDKLAAPEMASTYASLGLEMNFAAAAAALTGEEPGALTCLGLAISAPSADLVSTALAELGTAVLSGAHPIARGWSISSWLVAHASGLAVDRVTFDGRTWTMDSGTWSQTGPPDDVLSRHQAHSAA